MIISQVYLQQLQQQNTPHFIVYFSENQKIKKKNTNKKVRRAIKMNDALTIKLCTSKNKNKKRKSIFWTVADHDFMKKKVTHK